MFAGFLPRTALPAPYMESDKTFLVVRGGVTATSSTTEITLSAKDLGLTTGRSGLALASRTAFLAARSLRPRRAYVARLVTPFAMKSSATLRAAVAL